jgi:hypothetical protein
MCADDVGREPGSQLKPGSRHSGCPPCVCAFVLRHGGRLVTCDCGTAGGLDAAVQTTKRMPSNDGEIISRAVLVQDLTGRQVLLVSGEGARLYRSAPAGLAAVPLVSAGLTLVSTAAARASVRRGQLFEEHLHAIR